MRRAATRLGSALVLLVAAHVHAATLVFLDSDRGDVLGGGTARRLASGDGTFDIGTTGVGDVELQYTGRDGTTLTLAFVPPSAQPFAPGSYAYDGPDANDVDAGFAASIDDRTCTGSGTFVVHDAFFAPDGTPVAFDADFEHHCDGGAPALRGTVRIGAGDAACVTTENGTPCDDGDPCTAGDACLDGACIGALDAGRCTGDACHDAGACSPLTGACVAPVFTDGTPCVVDGCASGAACQAGVCTAPTGGCGGGGGSCAADPCTCDGAGPGCWNVASRAVITAWARGSGRGRTATCTVRCRTETTSSLVIDASGRYRMPFIAPGFCPSGAPADALEEIGTAVRRQSQLVLKPRNRRAIMAALRSCAGGRFTLQRYRTTVAVDAGGRRLAGATRLALVVPGRIATHLGVELTFDGARDTPTPSLGPPTDSLPVCTQDLAPVCTVR